MPTFAKKLLILPAVAIGAAIGMPVTGAVAIIGFTGCFDGRGSGPGTTSNGVGTAVALVGVASLVVMAACLLVAALLQLVGVPFPLGLAGVYATVCAAAGIACCLMEE